MTVLCDVQGLTHEKAARHLGRPVGTVKSRLARARELLRGRLSRRGLGLPAGLLVSERGLLGGLTLRAFDVVLPKTLVDSTIRAAGSVAAGKVLGAGVISSQVVILIEEALKTMVVSKLKLAAPVGADRRGEPRRGCSRSRHRGQRRTRERAVRQGPGRRVERPARNGWSRSGAWAMPTPAYTRNHERCIITRLEEEVAEARARLDQTLRKFGSADHPAVVRARETLEALVQRLDRIDRVLVDVVETYPTMVDFSGGPSTADPTRRPLLGAAQSDDGARDRLDSQRLNKPGQWQANTQGGWGDRLFDTTLPPQMHRQSGNFSTIVGAKNRRLTRRIGVAINRMRTRFSLLMGKSRVGTSQETAKRGGGRMRKNRVRPRRLATRRGGKATR